MNTIKTSKALYVIYCHECGRKFVDNRRGAKVCHECIQDNAKERSRISNERMSLLVLRVRPLKGSLRILECAQEDDLIVGGDVPEASMRLSVGYGYFSTTLRLVDYQGNVYSPKKMKDHVYLAKVGNLEFPINYKEKIENVSG